MPGVQSSGVPARVWEHRTRCLHRSGLWVPGVAEVREGLSAHSAYGYPMGRVTISLDDALLDDIDRRRRVADGLSVSRSGYIAMLIQRSLRTEEREQHGSKKGKRG